MLVVEFTATRLRMLRARGRRPLRWGSVGLGGADAYDRGSVLNRDEVLRRVRRLLEAVGARKGERAVLLEPTVLAVGDLVDVPRGLSRRKVEPALRSLAHRKLGGVDGLHIVWRVVATRPHVRAFAVGILKEHVSEHLSLLTESGIKVERVELHTLALSRMRRMGDGMFLVLEDGIDSILLFRGGEPAQAFARPSLDPRPGARMEAALQDIAAVRRESGAVPLVALSGPMAREEDAQWLRQHGLNAVLLPPPKGAEGVPQDFVPCAAALLPGRRLDLNPDALPVGLQSAARRAALSAAVAATILAGDVAYYHGVFQPAEAAIAATVAAARRTAPSAAGQAEAEAYLAAQAQASQIQKTLLQIQASEFPWSTVAQDLLAAAQTGVSIGNVSVGKGEGGVVPLSISGEAKNLSALNGFVSALSARFQGVTLGSVQASGSQLSFTANASYPEPGGAGAP